MEYAEDTYSLLIEKGVKPQEVRSILLNSLETKIIMTMNLCGWTDNH